MARRRELKAVCNDLLAIFVSRNNRIDGYWALGFFQAWLQKHREQAMAFPLIPVQEEDSEFLFAETAEFFRNELDRLAATRNIPPEWIVHASIDVTSVASDSLLCTATLTADNELQFQSSADAQALIHDPSKEFASGSGPRLRGSRRSWLANLS
ncbi:hypothetical protein [Croceicoccus sp. Ery5]|uniref:hypothetical protein n=1 Tax=Croceicoccus sp. Ery5 TaxID=1703340 RepID=UPI001E4819B1|nr:hypothetical protein [Croceicoccus sp. Ery5]